MCSKIGAQTAKQLRKQGSRQRMFAQCVEILMAKARTLHSVIQKLAGYVLEIMLKKNIHNINIIEVLFLNYHLCCNNSFMISIAQFYNLLL